MRALDIQRLGMVPYDEGLAFQRELVEARKADRIPDTLLLLEHPHVLTLGVRASKTASASPGSAAWPNVLATPERLAALVGIYETDAAATSPTRPREIVGYPIVDLRPISRTCTATCAISKRS